MDSNLLELDTKNNFGWSYTSCEKKYNNMAKNLSAEAAATSDVFSLFHTETIDMRVDLP